MPSVIGESVGRIVLGIDMSGSIGPAEIGQFLGNVKRICETVRPEGIDLLYWDTRVCQHEKYEQDQLDNLLSSTKPRGGGGTDPQSTHWCCLLHSCGVIDVKSANVSFCIHAAAQKYTA